MNSILIIVLAFVILFILQNIINSRFGINDILNKHTDNVINTNINNIKNHKRKAVKEIKERSKVKIEYKDPFYKFPDSMLSNISHPLSAGYKPLFQNTNDKVDMSDLNIVRKSQLDYYVRNPQVFNPTPVNKDTMDANPGNYTMQGLAKKWDGTEEKIDLTSDEYLTKYPKYASSNIKNELTNVGYFFDNDKHNTFIDHQERVLPDNCTISGDKMSCELNGALQPIPDKLMKNNSDVLNSIGVLTDDIEIIKSTNGYSVGTVDGGNYKIWNYPEEKSMNGGIEFGSVYASGPLGTNETYMDVNNRLNCESCAI